MKKLSRTDASDTHDAACQTKLDILLEQRVDLSTAIDRFNCRYRNWRQVHESV